jgi:hypothetical protein
VADKKDDATDIGQDDKSSATRSTTSTSSGGCGGATFPPFPTAAMLKSSPVAFRTSSWSQCWFHNRFEHQWRLQRADVQTNTCSVLMAFGLMQMAVSGVVYELGSCRSICTRHFDVVIIAMGAGRLHAYLCTCCIVTRRDRERERERERAMT